MFGCADNSASNLFKLQVLSCRVFFPHQRYYCGNIYVHLALIIKLKVFPAFWVQEFALNNVNTRAKCLPVKHHKPAAIGSAQAHNVFCEEKKLVFSMSLEIVSSKFPALDKRRHAVFVVIFGEILIENLLKTVIGTRNTWIASASIQPYCNSLWNAQRSLNTLHKLQNVKKIRMKIVKMMSIV